MTMKYLSVSEIAKEWNISERSVRNYCSTGKIDGVFLTGKTWNIPCDAQKPSRAKRKSKASRSLSEVLRAEKANGVSDGIYNKIQIELTYNSNHIEGSELSYEQTRYIFETNTVTADMGKNLNVDDIIETANHFKCIDMVIDNANYKLSENFIKTLHKTLKSGTSAGRLSRFNVGEYKKMPNEVDGKETVALDKVAERIEALLDEYNARKTPTIDDVLDFHQRFESIQPFQDGNGIVGRLLLFKECLRLDIVPFIIDEDLKTFYYRGLEEWGNDRVYLRGTCLCAQDKFKKYLDYFQIEY